MLKKTIGLCLALCAPVASQAAINSLDLSNYTITGHYDLPSGSDQAPEASAVTWNWDTGTLFVLGDEGDALVEVSTTGTLISRMTLTGFDDTEGLTYIGGGQFALVEERLQDAYQLTYSANGSVSRGSLASVSIGATTGNTGLEGLSYDPSTGRFILVKEKSSQAVYDATLNFGGSASVSSLFNPASLGLSDLSDVQVLSTVAASGSPDAGNLLIYSQESARLLEVDRTGTILSMFDFSGITDTAEGVTIDANGTIYIVDEEGSSTSKSSLYVLTPAPVPLPAAAWLMISGLAGMVGVGARRKRNV